MVKIESDIVIVDKARMANKLKEYAGRGLVSKETVVLRRWGSDTRKFGLSTELIM